MSTTERKELILKALQENQSVHAGELAARFGVSEDTIRRDLRGLADEGLIRRVYGGALPPTPTSPIFADRLKESVSAKSAIVKAALTFIRPKQTIFLDAGTTVAALATSLPNDMPLKVVTHSLPAAAALVDKPLIDSVVLGGKLYRNAAAMVGTEVVLGYGRVRADVCFLGITSVDADEGVAVLDYENAEVKRAMVNAATEVIALAAQDKLGTTSPFLVSPITAINRLVTEASAPADKVQALRSRGVEVLTV